MQGPATTPLPPSRATLASLRGGLEVLRTFPSCPPREGPTPSTAEILQATEATLRTLRSDIERLGPWTREFVGSSLVTTMATKAVDEALDALTFHLHHLGEPAATVSALIERPVHLAAARVEAILALMPGHVQLARRMSDRERSLRERARGLPSRLRRRFYVGLFVGSLFLLSVVVGAVVLLVPSVASASGVAAAIARYAPVSARVVLVAVLFFTGIRLILGSLWLTRTISILPEYEERRVHAAKAGIRRREHEVLDRLSPRRTVPEAWSSPTNSERPRKAPEREVPPPSE